MSEQTLGDLPPNPKAVDSDERMKLAMWYLGAPPGSEAPADGKAPVVPPKPYTQEQSLERLDAALASNDVAVIKASVQEFADIHGIYKAYLVQPKLVAYGNCEVLKYAVEEAKFGIGGEHQHDAILGGNYDLIEFMTRPPDGYNPWRHIYIDNYIDHCQDPRIIQLLVDRGFDVTRAAIAKALEKWPDLDFSKANTTAVAFSYRRPSEGNARGVSSGWGGMYHGGKWG